MPLGLSRFKKLEELGRGTYGVVCKAQRKSDSTIVALKQIIIDEKDAEEGIPSTAIREISLLKELEHPNVVTLQEVISQNTQLYLVFEYLDNDLRKFMDKRRPSGQRRCGLPLEEVKIYTHQMLKGIAFIHANRILHRDLKPQNLLIDANGRLKLADFGLARTFGIPARRLTREVITLWYRPPEILLGSQEYSVDVDIWSAGCIFGEMATGEPLFPGCAEIDELRLIFQNLGTPSLKEWPEREKLSFYNPLFPRFTPKPWDMIVPGLGELGWDLLSRMLVSNPSYRISAKQALNHPYFSGM